MLQSIDISEHAAVLYTACKWHGKKVSVNIKREGKMTGVITGYAAYFSEDEKFNSFVNFICESK